MMKPAIFLLIAASAAAFAQTSPTAREIGGRLTAAALKADVSFLASDAMEGRATPSKSQEIAAEFIAAQFRLAGLAPGGDDGYFQTANFSSVMPNSDGLKLTFDIGGKQITADAASMTIYRPAGADLEAAEAFRGGAKEITAMAPEQKRGKVLVVENPQGLNAALAASPALVVVLIQQSGSARAGGASLRDGSEPATAAPVLLLWDQAVRDAIAAAPQAAIKVSAHVPAPNVTPVKLRNVIGVLPGADPALKNTYVIFSAHYDHLGARGSGDDRIFNGANDNASGTASLIEIAAALAAGPARPKRSIVFLALFGEEVGEIGSFYYVRHPAFPLAKTVANINMEQLGRTDGSEGPNLLQFNMTGFDYSTLSPVFVAAAAEVGVKAVNDAKNGDSYFGRSDNARFADAGIPSTTVSVTYSFPDYHAVGDEWAKIDYENMAKVDCALALAAYRLADAAEPPVWNASNPRAERYVKARPAAQ